MHALRPLRRNVSGYLPVIVLFLPGNLAPSAGRSFSLARTFMLQFWLALLFSAFFLSCPAWTLAKQTGETAHSHYSAYEKGRERLRNLEHGKAGQQRINWLNAVREFRRLYWLAPNSSLAPRCLFMTAQTYAKMYTHFHLRLDLDESIQYYQKVASLFPKNTLADDALYNAALLLEKEKKDTLGAAELYTRIVHHYPKGDFSGQAREALIRLGRKKKMSVQESEHFSSLLPPATVSPLKYWASDDYTRIVVQISRPVSYTSKLLEKDGDQPRRLYLDLSSSRIAAQGRQTLPIEDGLLKQVRVRQLNNDTVRVGLEIQSISDYNIFNLNDPFRIVIDVHGDRKKRAPQTTARQGVVQSRPKIKPEFGQTSLPSREREAVAASVIILQDEKKRRPGPGQRIDPGSATKQKQDYSLAQQLGLGIRKIILDPGHGGKDPGAMAHGLKEKDIVLVVAKYLRNILRERYGYEVSLTRNRDVFLPLEERTALANTGKADLFVSIHVNAHPDKRVRGIETFYLNLATNSEAMRVAALENATSTHNISELQDILTDLMRNSKIVESSHLARYVQTNLVNGLKRNRYPVHSHGVKQAPFYVLIGAQMPAILAEISFITNPGDARLLGNKQYLHEIAEQLAVGLHSYAHKQLAAGQGH